VGGIGESGVVWHGGWYGTTPLTSEISRANRSYSSCRMVPSVCCLPRKQHHECSVQFWLSEKMICAPVTKKSIFKKVKTFSDYEAELYGSVHHTMPSYAVHNITQLTAGLEYTICEEFTFYIYFPVGRYGTNVVGWYGTCCGIPPGLVISSDRFQKLCTLSVRQDEATLRVTAQSTRWERLLALSQVGWEVQNFFIYLFVSYLIEHTFVSVG
jgi:hypothetical protein